MIFGLASRPARLAAALFAFFSAVARADAPAVPHSWDDVVSWASVNSPEIKAAEANYRSYRDLTRSTYGSGRYGGGFVPWFGLIGDYNRSETTNVNPGNQAPLGEGESTSAMLSVSANLFNGFGDVERVKQAKDNEQSNYQSMQIVKAKVSADLKSAFAGLIYARDSLDLTAKIEARRKQNLSLVELRYEGGRENKGSVLLYRAYLKDAAYNHLVARDLIDSAESVFAKVIGLDAGDVKNVTGKIPVGEPPKLVDFRSMIVGNPNHEQAVANEASSQAGVGIARSGLLPTLGLSGSVGRVDSIWFPQNPQWSVGIELVIPIFNGGHDYYTLKAAEETLAYNRANVDLADRVLAMNLKQAYYSYIEAIEKEGVDVQYLEAARVRADIGRNKYDNGLLTFEDWDLIETDLIARETNVLSSAKNRIVQESVWEQAQGRGVFQ